jgi:RNA ligase
MIHPARKLPFDDLIAGLEAARAAGNVGRRDGTDGRSLYVYTNRCVYDNGWDDFSLLARGLIVHLGERRLLATPFPKFFNASERGGTIPDLPFEVFEKVDGSLGILYYFDSGWRASTKGAFGTPQAAWMESRLADRDLSALSPATLISWRRSIPKTALSYAMTAPNSSCSQAIAKKAPSLHSKHSRTMRIVWACERTSAIRLRHFLTL